MFTTNSFRKRLRKKLVASGWSPSDAEAAAVAMFPMRSSPGSRQVEDKIRAISQGVALSLNPESGVPIAEQKQIVQAALDNYRSICERYGKPGYGTQYADAAASMSVDPQGTW